MHIVLSDIISFQFSSIPYKVMVKIVLFCILLIFHLGVASDPFKAIPGTKYTVSRTPGGQNFKPLEDNEPLPVPEFHDGGYFVNCSYGKANYNPLRSDAL